MLPVGHKRKRVQTKLFGDDFVRDDLRPGKTARRRKVMEPGGPDEAQGADALLSLAALAEQAESDTQSGDAGMWLLCCAILMMHSLEMDLSCCAASLLMASCCVQTAAGRLCVSLAFGKLMQCMAWAVASYIYDLQYPGGKTVFVIGLQACAEAVFCLVGNLSAQDVDGHPCS